MKIFTLLNIFLFISLLNSDLAAQTADEIFYNGTVYTVDSSFSIKSAFGVKNGKIIATGTDEEILKLDAKQKTDLKGKFVYPGFQDAHCHFYGYGYDLVKIWLTETPSWNAALDTVLKYNHKRIGGWIFGRGWDQNDWTTHVYPEKSKLDSLFPDTPVFLLRVDGHAALVNQVALNKAGITSETRVQGGEIEIKNGKLTGILIDNAVDIVYRIIPQSSEKEKVTALLNAQKNCFEKGLTSVTDAGYENTGLRIELIRLIDSLQKSDNLKMRINAMAAMEDYDWYANNGKIINPKLKVQSFKLYADGSLGSRGACLLQPYEDKPGHYGFLFYSPEQLDSLAGKVTEIEFQLNTHCIGDSSHRVMLKIYEKYIQGLNDPRWRIEHAQVTNPSDLSYYGRNKIIPSVQPVHATSDMYWAEKRIGAERMKGAYAYRDLMKQNNLIAAGSDFPVEDINPLFGFYAAVSRKDQKNFPATGFYKENALTREQALRAMTIWSAYAAFSEKETGSLEKGKFADFVILDEDLMKVREENIWKIKIRTTYLNGVKVYEMR
jgi:predicted amidohydrolase YtcJ